MNVFQLYLLLNVLLLYLSTLIAPKTENLNLYAELSLKKRNIILNLLINRLIAYIRYIINHGTAVIGIPPLDPFVMEDFHLVIPTGLFNLKFRFKNITVIGMGGFKMHRNNLHLHNLTFELEASVPRVIMSSEMMYISELDNDFASEIPIFNKDNIQLEMDNFRFYSILQLKQSEDEKSVLIDKIEDAIFNIPTFKINLDGVMDEQNLVEFSNIEGFMDYVNGCKDAITKAVSNAIITFGNPVLNRLDTWRYVSILL